MYNVIGVSPSPFVRKLLIGMAEKSLTCSIDPLIPVNVPESFLAKNPLGKIPVLEDGDVTIADSSVILAYLEKKHPERPLYCEDPRDLARALWIEEYADTKMADTINPNIYFQRAIAPIFFDKETDEALVQETINEHLPPIFDYLESQVQGAAPFIEERFSIGDVALATQAVNLHLANVTVGRERWPKLAAYFNWLLARPSVAERITADRAEFEAAAQPA